MAVIYQYQCKDPSITDSYIGSTCNFIERKRGHKKDSFNIDKATPFHKFVLEHGGWENWDCIVLAEIEEGIEKQERFILEQAFIRQLNPTLNSKKAFRTEEERIEFNKKFNAEWQKKKR